MKTIKFITLSLIISSSAFAQKISVSEGSERIGGGSNNALSVTIYEADIAEVEKEWKSIMRGYNAKISSQDGAYFADNAVIKPMGNNTVDVYYKAEKGKDTEIKFMAAFDLGGAFMSSSKHGEQYQIAKKMVYDFAMKMTKESIAGQLKAAQKVHDKLVDKHKDLVKDEEGLKKDIEEWKAKIKKAEDEIVKNKEEQGKKKTEIEAQKKVVDAIAAKEKAVN